MKIFLADDKRIIKYNLPTKIEEYFLITYKDIEGLDDHSITIEAESGNLKLKSNGDVNIVSSQGISYECILTDYCYSHLKINGQKDNIILFTTPTQEEKLYKIDYTNLNKITIGNSPKNQINYKHDLVSEVHAEIELIDGIWYIKVAENIHTSVYLNSRKITSAKLKCGDIVFLAGLKLIWMKDFIEVNNPNKALAVTGMSPYGQLATIDNHVEPLSDEESNIDLYNDNDYFYHTPRMKEKMENQEVVIDPPPGQDNKDEVPFILTMGSTFTMAASSFVTGFLLYDNLSSGRKTVFQSIPQIVMLSAMLLGSILLPKLLRSYNKKRRIKREKERQEKYSIYLHTKEDKIVQIMKHQTQILFDNNDSAIQCSDIIMKRKQKIWGREQSDDDFLTARLGLGDVASKIEVTAPVEHFTLDIDNLFENVYKVVESSKILKDVPITYSFTEKPLTAMVFNCSYKEDYINGIITQFIALHSGADLKIVILTDSINAEKWEYMKILPHCWSDDRSIRFFGTNIEEYNEISNYINEELKNRKEKIANKNQNSSEEEVIDRNDGYKNFSPYFLIITDNYRKAKNAQFLTDLLKTKENLGFSIITIADNMKNLPNNCEDFIEIGEKTSCILNKELSAESQQVFTNEHITGLDMEMLSTKVANIPLMPKDGLYVFPTSLSFLDMLNVSRIEQLNILNRWQVNSPVTSLSTTIGVHSNGEPFKLDLHEKFHGPHGLIAGSTGSGKSEFIITYILSMAVNYHPYEVQFVLIDYKGGGLAGAFENKETGVRIPHLIGTITNLDTSEMNRTLVSIESELKRRQVVFNTARDALGESTIDIYKYQRLYREGLVKEPMAHLFIISDEFAELKSQQPEFMTQLISTARIGRSLGVHLVLATQKPSGVVNDQIWSNAKFKVCLKVQDRGDSMEMLKKPDAASLKEAGRFYLQVGYDDYFDIGQSGWGGAKYIPSNKIIKRSDDSLSFVNNIGYVFKTANEAVKKETTTATGDQLTNLVKYIADLSEKETLKTKKLWLDKIPPIITINDIKKKYNYNLVQYQITPVIGEYDNPSAQEQGILKLDLTNKGNTLIYGQSGSGKENLLSTIIWSIMTEHTPTEVNMYIIDCGAETLKMFYKIPHVGEIATVDESEKIIDIIKMIGDEMENRKNLFADYAGSYLNYLQNSGEKLPLIVVVLNNYEMFTETYNKISEGIQPIYRDCHKYGIVFIITATTTSSVRVRMSQNFENKICLQLPNDGDYRTILNSPKGLFPYKSFGRGIVGSEDTGYEFQTANICDLKDLNNTIKAAAEKLNAYYKDRAKKILSIPAVVNLSEIKENITTVDKLPLGYNMENKEISFYNFTDKKINLILSNDMGEKIEFIYAIIKELLTVNSNVFIIDFANGIETKFTGAKYFDENFDQAFAQMAHELENESASATKNFYIFLGIGDYKSKLSETGKQIANNIFNNVSLLENSYIIFIDNYSSYKRLAVETWFQVKIDNSCGIWLGEGVGSQVAINASNITMEDRKLDFAYMGFLINNSKRTIIKCVVDDGIEEAPIDEK